MIRFCCLAVLAMLATGAARAQEEIPPPQGSGRVVVVLSGKSGPEHYETVAHAIAQLGYDVVLFDSNPMIGTHGEAVRAAIQQAQRSPHGLPGKVGMVGFSLGGGFALYYGSQWSDLVAGVAAWYPLTREIQDAQDFASRLSVPVVMFAGGQDTYKDCCLVDKARALAAAASARHAAFDLTVYPDAEHDFVIGGRNYNAADYTDALRRTAASLRSALGS